MMHSITLVALGTIMFFVSCNASDTQDGLHDHHASNEDHHHHHEEPIAVTKLVVLKDQISHIGHHDGTLTLTYTEVTNAVEILLERFQCASRISNADSNSCVQCTERLTNRVFDTVGVEYNSSLNEETFTAGCSAILSTLVAEDLEESCHNDFNGTDQFYLVELLSYGGSATRLQESEMGEYLEDLDKNYSPQTYSECFDEEVLFDELVNDHVVGATIGEVASVSARIIANLIEGQCIGHALYPNPEEFTDSILEIYGSNGMLPLQGLVDILQDLELINHDESVMTSSEEEDHDHKDVSADHTDHDHHHDHDHDHDHDHHRRSVIELDESVRQKRHVDYVHEVVRLNIDRCLSAEEIFLSHGMNTSKGLTHEDFHEICPALIQQKVGDYCKEEHRHHTAGKDKLKSYIYGSIFVLLVTLSALLGALIFPCVKGTNKELLLNTFVGLAVSTLTSEAMLHLLPSVFGLHSHEGETHSHSDSDGNHQYLWKSVMVLVAIYIFYLMEVVAVYLKKDGHSRPGVQYQSANQKDDNSFPLEAGETKLPEDEQNVTESKYKVLKYGTLPLMIIVSGCFHNFADGLAIGATFSISLGRGFSTGIAIVFHELSHEIGDLAILLKSGMPMKWALIFNVLSGVTSFFGLYIGLVVGTTEEAQQWILAITAGMFLYIGLVDMMPTIIDLRNTSQPRLTFILQNVAFIVGALIIILVGELEHKINVNL